MLQIYSPHMFDFSVQYIHSNSLNLTWPFPGISPKTPMYHHLHFHPYSFDFSPLSSPFLTPIPWPAPSILVSHWFHSAPTQESDWPFLRSIFQSYFPLAGIQMNSSLRAVACNKCQQWPVGTHFTLKMKTVRISEMVATERISTWRYWSETGSTFLYISYSNHN